jgi:hypothetical protein
MCCCSSCFFHSLQAHLHSLRKSGWLAGPIAVVQLRFGQSNGTVALIGEVRPKEALRLIDPGPAAETRRLTWYGGVGTRSIHGWSPSFFCDRDGHLAKTRPTLLWRTATAHAENRRREGTILCRRVPFIRSLSFFLSFVFCLLFFLKKRGFSFFRNQKRGVVSALGRVH